jgi:hypothetical protein
MAGSTATCTGSFDCEIKGGFLGVYPGTNVTGNFVGDTVSTADAADCAAAGLDAWTVGRAMTSEKPMLAEMGGLTFKAGVYTHESSINIAATNPTVYLDAEGEKDAVFIFNTGSTLTTCADSEIVLKNGARKENVFWVLGTALTMGADSVLVGNVLAGTAITMGTNAKISGRAIGQTAVTCETGCTIETFQMADNKGDGQFDNECKFPFTYYGVEYNDCTPDQHYTYWCYTLNASVDWGNCEPTSPPRPTLTFKMADSFGDGKFDNKCKTQCTSVNHDTEWCFTLNTPSDNTPSDDHWGNCEP